MKTLITASLLALSVGMVAAPTVQAQDVGGAIARGAIRGALGDPGPRYDRDRYEGRSSGYGGDCRTVTVQRDGPYGPETRTTRRCD